MVVDILEVVSRENVKLKPELEIKHTTVFEYLTPSKTDLLLQIS